MLWSLLENFKLRFIFLQVPIIVQVSKLHINFSFNASE
jgi:hypothetical protein